MDSSTMMQTANHRILKTSRVKHHQQQIRNHHHHRRKVKLKHHKNDVNGTKSPQGRHQHHHHQHLNVQHHKLRQASSRASFFKRGRFSVDRYAAGGGDDVNDGVQAYANGKCDADLKDIVEVEDEHRRNNNDNACFSDCTGKFCIDRAAEVKEETKGVNYQSSERDDYVIGSFTREVYKAVCLRLGDIQNIPEDSVKTLFNDMQLYPSDTEVRAMLQCARQYRNAPNHYLTFGELCFLVREMQNHQKPKIHRKSMQQKINNKQKCSSNKCEVFLGGSCNPTTWRADTAIPELKKLGISFYNPQVSIWAPELLAQEHDAKQSASVLLFVIDSQTRSTVGMLEVAYLVASGRCVIVVAQPYRKGQSIMGETITDKEYCDLMQGQKSLLDLIKSRGVQIHNNLTSALQCTANILRNATINGKSPEDQISYKLKRLREVYDSYKGDMQLYDVIDAYRKLTNRSLEISKLYNYLNLQNGNVTKPPGNGTNSGQTNGTLSFEKFCALMAELSSDGCEMCNIEAWATQSFARNQHTQCPNEQTRTRCAVDPTQIQNYENRKHVYDVYLGGSLSTGTKWREDLAIPLFKKYGVDYYNPALREWNDLELESTNETSQQNTTENVMDWRERINQCKIALFVITNDTRSLTTMIVAAHYIGSGKDVVLSIEHLNSDSCVVVDETLTKNATKDYNRARAYLRDVAERRQVPVFDSAEEAVRGVLLKLSKTTLTDQTDSRSTDLDR